jgi:8-oxo-dGDP phosphatase
MTKRGPAVEAVFEKIGERTIYQGKVFNFLEDTWRSPDGDVFERQVIRNRGAVAVLPLHDDNTITLIHQFRPAFGAAIWEIPAGLLDKPGESRPDAAVRELREEVGLEADSMRQLLSMRPAPGLSDERTTLFLATGLRFVGLEADGPEERFLHIERLPILEARAMIANDEIEDAKTVLSIMFALEQLGS